MTPRMIELLTDTRAGVSARVIGLYIAAAGQLWTGYRDFCNELGMSSTTAQKAINQLLYLGYVEKLPRCTFNGSCGWLWLETPNEERNAA